MLPHLVAGTSQRRSQGYSRRRDWGMPGSEPGETNEIVSGYEVGNGLEVQNRVFPVRFHHHHLGTASVFTDGIPIGARLDATDHFGACHYVNGLSIRKPDPTGFPGAGGYGKDS